MSELTQKKGSREECEKLTRNSTPSVSKNMAKCGKPLVLIVSTLASLPSVVKPLKVKLRSFFPNGAIANNGSKYHPILLPKSQLCMTDPPLIVPGWNKSEVPV